MRFKISLHTDTPQTIPINYQYPLSAWIYRVFQKANPEFSEWLHRHGYAFSGNRRFKLFTFSWLETTKAKLIREKRALQIYPGENYFSISFCMTDAATEFIAGIFQNQELVIANQQVKGSFSVAGVERIEEPLFETGYHEFTTESPVVVSRPRYNGRNLRAEYVFPEDENYSELLNENLLKRYAAANQSVIGMIEAGPEYEALTDFPFDADDWQWELLGKPQKRGQLIKEGRPEQTQVIGYSYRFRLSAPEELLSFAWNCGLSEKGSIGFGCIGLIETNNSCQN